MKQLIFILALTLLFSCKKETPEPESKTAPLLIELTGEYPESIYCKTYFTQIGQNSEYYTTSSGTTINWQLSKPDFKGGVDINFGSTSYKVSDSTKATAYGTSSEFYIKVTYNGQVLANNYFKHGDVIFVNVSLPVIK